MVKVLPHKIHFFGSIPGDRHQVWGTERFERRHLGNILKIEGLVIGGEGAQAILMLPNTLLLPQQGESSVPVEYLTLEDWTDFLARTDNPEILIMPAKAFHRKVRYEVSGAVQQKIWVADGYKCVYCGAVMGKSPMSIDHFVPLETGGANDTSNFLTACKGCNKKKGSMDPHEWCLKIGKDYDWFLRYLSTRQLP